jgi:hypothetical protein
MGDLKHGLIFIEQGRLHIDGPFGPNDPFHISPHDDGGIDAIGPAG